MNLWNTPLKNGKTPMGILSDLVSTRTDKEIAQELTKAGFKATNKSVRGARIRAGIKKVQADSQDREVQTVSGNTWNIRASRTVISSVEDLVSSYNIDTRLWKIVEFSVSRREVVQKSDDDFEITPLNSIRAVLKKREDVSLAYQEIESLKEDMRKYSPKPVLIKRANKPSDTLLEMCLPDIHFGKVAWHLQTGYEDYDVSIARRIFSESVSSLMSQVEPYKFEQILFVAGNDVFHTDNQHNTTFSGVPMDSADTRYHRTFRIVREVMVETIESLRSVAPVKVLIVPGNHDRMTSFHLGDSLECWFSHYDDVTIDNSPAPRKYHRWGNVLLMFTHGDKGKRADYDRVMARERPEDWGETLYREIHTGDKHQTKVEEKFGVRVRILPSLTGADSWHSENMFIGNQRQAEAFVWSKDRGLLGTAIYTHKEDVIR